MPAVSYSEYYTGFYGEKTVGVTRYWTAQTWHDQIDQLVEIHRNGTIKTNDVAHLAPFYDTAEAATYIVRQVQHLYDDDGLPVTDLSLERMNFDTEVTT